MGFLGSGGQHEVHDIIGAAPAENCRDGTIQGAWRFFTHLLGFSTGKKRAERLPRLHRDPGVAGSPDLRHEQAGRQNDRGQWGHIETEDRVKVTQDHVRFCFQSRDPNPRDSVLVPGPPKKDSRDQKHQPPTRRQLDDDPAWGTGEQRPVQLQDDVEELFVLIRVPRTFPV